MDANRTASDFGSSDEKPGDSWYYADAQGKPCGPVSYDELKHLVASGTVKSGTLVMKKGGTVWNKVLEVFPNLFPSVPFIPERPSRLAIYFALAASFLRRLVNLWRNDPLFKGLTKATTVAGVAIVLFWAFAGKPLSLAAIFCGPVVAWIIWKSKAEAGKKRFRITAIALLALLVLFVDSGRGRAKPGTADRGASNQSRFTAAGERRKTSDFDYVFSDPEYDIYEINEDAQIVHLSEFVEGIYSGGITPKEGKRVAFGYNSAAFDAHVFGVTGDFVIYEVRNYRGRIRFDCSSYWQIAVPRDKGLEENSRGEDNLKEVYKVDNMMMSDPLFEKRAIVLAGFRQFTTVSGVVKNVPVFDTVFIEKQQ